VLYAGLYTISVNYQYFTITNPLNQNTTVPGEISFRDGEKAVANRQA
jgi:hypothetical protein